jgi:hypothetical protein
MSNGTYQTTLRKISAPQIFFCGSKVIVYNDKFYLHRIIEVGLIVQNFELTVWLINLIYEIHLDNKM